MLWYTGEEFFQHILKAWLMRTARRTISIINRRQKIRTITRSFHHFVLINNGMRVSRRLQQASEQFWLFVKHRGHTIDKTPPALTTKYTTFNMWYFSFWYIVIWFCIPLSVSLSLWSRCEWMWVISGECIRVYLGQAAHPMAVAAESCHSRQLLYKEH